MLCPGFLAPAVIRMTDGTRAFTLPWGTEGDKVEVTAAQGAASGRNQAFFVLMAGAGLRGKPCAPGGPAPDSSAKRA